MKKKVLGYYNYTVILTYGGMLIAFYGILCAINQEFWNAIFCLMLAGICDMFDGTVAATKERTASEKRFGIQIDSLSDLICFGVLPAIFVYMYCEQNKYIGIVCALFVLCALIRLSYFNVMEEERQNKTNERRKTFNGVPVTTLALLLPIVYIIYENKIIKSMLYFPIFLALMGTGFLSTIEVKKPGAVGKTCIVIIGLIEMIAMFLFTGRKIV